MASISLNRPVGGFLNLISAGRERLSAAVDDETVFFNLDTSKKVNCGPLIGEVTLNHDGSVILNASQLAALTGYEMRENLEPSVVQKISDDKYRVSMRK